MNVMRTLQAFAKNVRILSLLFNCLEFYVLFKIKTILPNWITLLNTVGYMNYFLPEMYNHKNVSLEKTTTNWNLLKYYKYFKLALMLKKSVVWIKIALIALDSHSEWFDKISQNLKLNVQFWGKLLWKGIFFGIK